MKKMVILIVIVAVIALAWWVLSGSKTETSTTGEAMNGQTTTSNDDLEGLGEADLDAEFKVIDEDASKL